MRVLREEQCENTWGEGERHFAFGGIFVEGDVLFLVIRFGQFQGFAGGAVTGFLAFQDELDVYVLPVGFVF